VRGRHTINLGFSFRSTDWKDTGEVFPSPTYALGTPTGDPVPGVLFTAANLPGAINTELGNSTAAALYNSLIGRVAQANVTRVVNPDTFQYDGFHNWTWTRSYMGGAFVQDRWRVKPSLTLNYGLRWEVQGDMYDVKGITASPDRESVFGPSTALFSPGTLSGNFNPTAQVGRRAYTPDYNNFAPNVGVSWNPEYSAGWLGKLVGGNKTVLRGSFSVVVYDEGTNMFASNLGPNLGKTISANLVPGQSVLAQFTTLSDMAANPVPLSAFAFTTTEYRKVVNQADQTFRTGLNGMDPNLRAPYTLNWSFGAQREVARNTVVEARYVGTQGRGQWRTANINEVNIFENGFLQEFTNAQRNLAINRAAGVQSFANLGRPGQVALPSLEAAFGARGSVAALPAGSGFQSAGFITNLDNGGAGALANTLATNRDYVCRMFGNRLAACPGFANPGFNVEGPYPVNFFLLNPYVAGRLNYVEGTGRTWYNGLQLQLRRRSAGGLTWTANYTWSSSLTNNRSDNATLSSDWRTRRNVEMDRVISPFDIRHVVQMFGTYDLPFGRDRRFRLPHRLLDAVAGGWTVGSVLVFNTGQPVQLAGGGFNNVNTSDNAMANGVRLAPGVTLEQIRAMFQAPRIRMGARADAIDTSRIAVDPRLIGPDGRANPDFLQANRTPGDFGQLLYLPGRNNFNWDASLTKHFRLSEKLRFELFSSASNVLNRVQWGMPNTSVFSTQFGIVGPPSGQRQVNFRGTLSF
jgi:hypothetical protein